MEILGVLRGQIFTGVSSIVQGFGSGVSSVKGFGKEIALKP